MQITCTLKFKKTMQQKRQPIRIQESVIFQPSHNLPRVHAYVTLIVLTTVSSMSWYKNSYATRSRSTPWNIPWSLVITSDSWDNPWYSTRER